MNSLTEEERAHRVLATALRVAGRLARPGQTVEVTHWWGGPNSAPQSITAKEIV